MCVFYVLFVFSLSLFVDACGNFELASAKFITCADWVTHDLSLVFSLHERNTSFFHPLELHSELDNMTSCDCTVLGNLRQTGSIKVYTDQDAEFWVT